MVNSKLTQLFQTFEPRDFRRFREYLASPYFNKREDLIRFYAVWESRAPAFSPSELSKASIWEGFAPGTPLDGKALNYLCNFLLKHAEKFLAVESLQNDPVEMGIRALAHCWDHSLEKHCRSITQRSRKIHEQATSRDAFWHFQAWHLADAEMHGSYRSRTRSQQVGASLTAVARHLDSFYWDIRLELTSEILNLNQIFQQDHSTEFIPPMLELLDHLPDTAPSVEVRRWILNLLRNPLDHASFERLREILPRSTDFFPLHKVKGIFAYAQNHCIRRIKAGDADYGDHLFWIYQEAIEAEIIYEWGEISPWNFKNVCSVGLRQGEFEWVERFIESNAERVPRQFRDNAIAYNRGHLRYYQGKFGEALRSLSQVEYSDVFYALDTRRLMLKIYSERQDTEPLRALAAAFRAYLTRNKLVSEVNRRAYRNFVDWTLRIDQGLTESERQELEQCTEVVEREWLLSRA